MKNILILFILMQLPLSRLCAQAEKHQHEFELGAGLASSYYILQNISFTPGGQDHYSSSGTYGLSYRYYLSKRFSLGINISYERMANYPIFANPPAYSYSDDASFITLSPELTCSYVDKIMKDDEGDDKIPIRLYFLAALGITNYHDKVGSEPATNAIAPLGLQITPFGMRIGKALAGYLEIGIGYKGIVNAGVSYRLPKKKIKTTK